MAPECFPQSFGARLVIIVDGRIKCLFQVCNAALSISDADGAQSVNCPANPNPGLLFGAAAFFHHALFAKGIYFLEASFTCDKLCAQLRSEERRVGKEGRSRMLHESL